MLKFVFVKFLNILILREDKIKNEPKNTKRTKTIDNPTNKHTY